MKPSRDEPFTVGDLFCGAGGFAEGFRQAGCSISWGVDSWKPAIDTFGKNFPDAHAIQADVLGLQPDDLAPVDILIGSPPCVHFSPANRGGGGNRAKGMLLVRRFLDFVRLLKPRAWVMENVPAMLPDLEAEMSVDTYVHPTEGWTLPIPVRRVLDAAKFGVPQSRKRLFSGAFALPVPTHSYEEGTVLTLRRVIETLPDPDSAVPASQIGDPVYPGWTVPATSLRDHFEDIRRHLTDSDIDSARSAKEHHPVYGKMSFPDDIDRPSRTITATRTRGSRETIVVPGLHGLRTLTLRESASVQGFPLSYQFWASRIGQRDSLVGNAVCPLVSRAIAGAILQSWGRRAPKSPFLANPTELAPPRHF